MSVKRKKIVLVVDDKRVVRSFIRAIIEHGFEEYDMEILTAPSSDTALKIIEQKHGGIDLISTNINRPGMDGIVFIHFVKFKYPHIKILICSGSVKTGDLEELFEGKLADAYIRKPIREKDYVNKIRNIFESQNVVRLSFPA
ncbi:MAG: response regulator of RpoS [Deltaproteobacteria bacterium ADurb.BinA179]|jgi:CheY-like chemotaxis protein|nr:MAG: response regulator of RpoS [Deltaproteobacteria bacterium ADurb.BinA179]HNU73307.1 response regulator [Deltaproteobacteria bacterium]HRT45499.1 response regulator [Desulfomonilia bacterium]HOD71188.1 response regulator [Deltaproteobacteria bacterium]HOE71455.1 response regulator [Deltaproteobacteria bacterium]